MLYFRTATVKHLGWFLFCFILFPTHSSPHKQLVDTHKIQCPLRTSLASLPWKKMESKKFSEEPHFMCVAMGLHWQRRRVAYLGKYSFLICFLTIAICFPSGWKSAAIDHPMRDAYTDRLRLKIVVCLSVQTQSVLQSTAVVPVKPP